MFAKLWNILHVRWSFHVLVVPGVFLKSPETKVWLFGCCTLLACWFEPQPPVCGRLFLMEHSSLLWLSWALQNEANAERGKKAR